jgi:hypothetical protein
MTITEAKQKIEGVFLEYVNKFESYGAQAAIEFSYDTKTFKPCKEEDRAVAIMSGDLSVRTRRMKPADAIYYGVVVDVSRRREVDGEKLDAEIAATRALLDEILEEMALADDVEVMLEGELTRITAENRAAMDEFNKKMKSMETTAKIITIIGVAVVLCVAVFGFFL